MVTPERYHVAILAIATSVEQEAAALAADLGTIAYEERVKLAAGVPAIVLSTPELGRAEALAGTLRARRHAVHVCRASDVVASSAMTSMRRFGFDAEAIVAGDARLPWHDVSVLVRATQRRLVETTETVKEKKLSLGRALVTGGLVMRKSTERAVVTRSEDFEPVLYLFRHGGAPWLLREHGTHYGALGAMLAPVSSRNFAIAVEQIRARAPHARFDDRLLARKSATDIDLLAHLIAIAATP